jgi:hypothetical protein
MAGEQQFIRGLTKFNDLLLIFNADHVACGSRPGDIGGRHVIA